MSIHLKKCYLVVGKLEPWLLAVGENLPQNDAEAPHVALGGEFAVHYAFRRHPANRKHRMTSDLQGKKESRRVN